MLAKSIRKKKKNDEEEEFVVPKVYMSFADRIPKSYE